MNYIDNINIIEILHKGQKVELKIPARFTDFDYANQPQNRIQQVKEHNSLIRNRKKEIYLLLDIIEQTKELNPEVFEFGSAFNKFNHHNLYSGEISHFLSLQENTPYFGFEPNYKELNFIQKAQLKLYSMKHNLNKNFFNNVKAHQTNSFEEIQEKIQKTISSSNLPIYFSNNLLYQGFNPKFNFLNSKGLHVHSFYLDDILSILRDKIDEECDSSETRREQIIQRYFPSPELIKNSLSKSIQYIFNLDESISLETIYHNDDYLNKAVVLWYSSPNN